MLAEPQTLTKEKVNISVDIEDANSVSVVIFLGDDVDVRKYSKGLLCVV